MPTYEMLMFHTLQYFHVNMIYNSWTIPIHETQMELFLLVQMYVWISNILYAYISSLFMDKETSSVYTTKGIIKCT